MKNETINSKNYSINTGIFATANIPKGYAFNINGSAGNSAEVIGITSRSITIGELIEAHPYGEARSGIAGEAFAKGANLTSDADGKLIIATAGTKVLGIAYEASTAEDQEVSLWTTYFEWVS